MTEKEFVLNWTAKLRSDSIKNFPSDFNESQNCRHLQLPGKALVIGEEFFGSYEIITTDGSCVYQAPSYDEAKFIVYSNREKIPGVDIPENPKEIKAANTKYENYLDSLIRTIEADHKKKFPDIPGATSINEIFRALNLTRY